MSMFMKPPRCRMLSGHGFEPASVSPSPALPVAAFFGFSPRLAVDLSNGDIFISVGSSVLVFDAGHSQILANHQLFAHGCISCIVHSNHCLVAASGSRICILTDVARAQGAEPQIVHCGRSHVLACAYAQTAVHPLVALLQGGGCRGTGVVVHFSAGCDARLNVAKIVDAPAWPSRTGGMCSCACIAVDSNSCRDRFICATGSYMGDVCIWDSLTGTCIGNRASVHTGPVRAIDMRRRRDGAWVLCSGGEDWRVCVSYFAGAHGSVHTAGVSCGQDGGSSFTIDCRVRSVCISPRIDDFNLCLVGSQTGRVFSISLKSPPSLICSLLLDAPDIDHVACSPDFIFCCGRNGAVLRVPIASITGSLPLPCMQQLSPVPALPAVTSVCVDPSRMCIICLHGPSIISEYLVSSCSASQFRIISNAIWSSTPSSSAMGLPSTLPSSTLSSTSCLASDAGFVAVFGCRGDAALIHSDGYSLQLLPQPSDTNRFYLCCCHLQDDLVLSGAAIRSNGTIYVFRADNAVLGHIASAEFGILNRLGRCSALDCTAAGPSDLVVCAGSIAGTLVLYCGWAERNDGPKAAAVAQSGNFDSNNAILIMKKLHGMKPVSCIRLKRDPPTSGSSHAHFMHLYSAGHDGCIVLTRLHVARGSCHIIAQQRVCIFDSAPVIAFSISSRRSKCSAAAIVSHTSIQNGRVFHSHGPFSILPPSATVGVVDQHRFSSLAAACSSSKTLLADICKGQVRVMAADAQVGCHRIIPGLHTDTINDIAFVCYESANQEAADSGGRAIMCTVSTDGCCCICSIPLSSVSSAYHFQVLARLCALKSQVAGCALMCIKVVWLGHHRALVVAGGAFSCVHVRLLLFYPPDDGGYTCADVISHASYTCNACDDEGKCVSAIHCNTIDTGDATTGLHAINVRISACLNDGRVVVLSCLVSSLGAVSIEPSEQAPLRFSHAIMCVSADSRGRLFFGLSNGCLLFADSLSPQPHSPGNSSAEISATSSLPLCSPISSCCTTALPSELPAILPLHCALHIAGLNAMLPLDYGWIVCGGEDGSVSVSSLGTDGRFSVHDMRRVSDGAVRKLLLLRRRLEIGGCTIMVDVGVICHNQRSLTVSVRIQNTNAMTNDLLTGSVGPTHNALITSVSDDFILDVGKSWSACVVGAALEDGDLNSPKIPAHVVIGGWGVQMIQM